MHRGRVPYSFLMASDGPKTWTRGWVTMTTCESPTPLHPPSMLTRITAIRMFDDVDHSHPEVRSELFKWAEWLDGQLDLGGLRLDAVKHFSRGFVRDFLTHMDQVRKSRNKPPWFVVGEYFPTM